MPDITMCHGLECTKKDKCYRHTAIPSLYQSYFYGMPEPQNCEYFIEIEKEYMHK